ncbi:Phosphatidylcholine synthase [Aliiroseovarius pelagivivens]|uniref:CDP-diacylglycerol--serine O-phosphatidyltransferase n=1 Tax=Aliiroseovarius pelagivivens TaxID=1639690 RepID=A0A2R8ASJ0_9RHOB|nr:CDP-diacylglycerol--serine O-phosphatidyltransferase [Aliiroseovarius pelagivivens]SPF78854.1 Phosphatidylcholine synthase [Aliiroseovarius pelagivivens]
MAEPLDSEKQSDIRLIYLLPNLITIAAICAGLTAIRFGYEGNFELAVQLILAACVLDGLDGRVARLLKRSTAVGAELDSLADFVNFGVAPVLILHSWAFQDFRSAGWIAVLFYAICCVLRLARFNVSGRLETGSTPSEFFVGVPSPAGAVLVILPMVFSFAVSDMPLTPPAFVAFYICLVGLLMISRIPTYSFKNMAMDRANAKFFLLGAAILTAALLTYLWATLTFLTLVYVVCLVWAYRCSRKSKPVEG